jgi:hypothetical protein
MQSRLEEHSSTNQTYLLLSPGFLENIFTVIGTPLLVNTSTT